VLQLSQTLLVVAGAVLHPAAVRTTAQAQQAQSLKQVRMVPLTATGLAKRDRYLPAT
jgi:hypothetical protein